MSAVTDGPALMGTASDPSACGPGETCILLVDDNPSKLLALATILTELGETLVTAGSGEEALRKLLAFDFAVILLDVNMPGMDGFETATLVRQRKRNEHTPIIFMSAISPADTHAHRGYSLGAVDYVFTPIVPEILRTKVRVFVELFKQRREVQRQAELVRQLQERQLQNRLFETNERLRLALDAGRMGGWELDLRNDRMNWMPLPERVAQADPRAQWTTLEQFLQSLHEEDRAGLRAALERTRREGAELQFELRVPSPGGGSVWLEMRGRVFRDDEQGALRLAGVYGDTTGRKRVEDELRQARDAADRANRAKDVFLAALSHELRTPLTPALMVARAWGARPDLPADVRADLEIVRRSIETEKRLIDDLLDITRIERAQITLSFETLDFHTLIQDALHAGLEEQRAAKNISVQLQLDAARRLVFADATRLQQVLWNLVSNALKFTPAGGWIRVATHNDSAASISLTVADSGIGIKPEHMDSIFQLFEQGDAMVAKRFGGLGLGLAICKTMVELHQGEITVASAGPGRGATFCVRLPLAAVPETAGPETKSAAPRVGGLRILVVEDHEDTAALLVRVLRGARHQVQVASCVQEALALFAAAPFDLLMSDVGLPDGTGFDLMRAIRQSSRVRAIALTGYGQSEDVAQALEAGFDVHFTKPFDLDKLQEVMARLFEERADSSR